MLKCLKRAPRSIAPLKIAEKAVDRINKIGGKAKRVKKAVEAPKRNGSLRLSLLKELVSKKAKTRKEAKGYKKQRAR